jgi:TPR repeat protein
MYNLGMMYLDGQGVAQSRPKAMHLLEKAADLGLTEVRI